MNLIKFILSSFWVWLGFVVLVALILSRAVELVKACKRERKIATYKMGDVFRVEITGATHADVQHALAAGAIGAAAVTVKEGSNNAE